jgi:hypothetical protein
MMRATLILSATAALIVGLAPGPAPAAGPIVVALEGGTVEVRPEPGKRRAVVKFGGQTMTVPAGAPSSPKTVVASIGAKAGYLFIDRSNESNAWRGRIEQVFKIEGGKLVRLGAVAGKTEEEAPKPGYALEDGRFLDIDDQLEGNALTSHAEAPGIWVALREEAGRLVYDPTQCWTLNEKTYADNAEELKKPQQEESFDPAALFLAQAVIDTYCERTAERAADLAAAKSRLKPKEYKTMVGVLGTLRVGKGLGRLPKE